MTRKLIEVKMPTFPSLPDFETVVDAALSPGIYRRTFTAMFFDEMLRRRMNASMEGAILEIALKAAQSLAAAYEANVSFGDLASDRRLVIYTNVAAFVNQISFDDAEMINVIDEDLSRRMSAIWTHIENRNEEASELLESDEQQLSVEIAQSWLDYIEIVSDTSLFKYYVRAKRELTILVRSYELLIASIVTRQGR